MVLFYHRVKQDLQQSSLYLGSPQTLWSGTKLHHGYLSRQAVWPAENNNIIMYTFYSCFIVNFIQLFARRLIRSTDLGVYYLLYVFLVKENKQKQNKQSYFILISCLDVNAK